MKRLTYSLTLSLATASLALADHHGDKDVSLAEQLDKHLAGIAQSDEAKRYEPRMALQAMTSAASTPGAKQRDAYVKLLLERLASGDTAQAGKAWILAQLENVGGAESVPALKKMMGSPFHHLRERARRALEQNPSKEAGEALRALAKDEQDRRLKRALIHSLGQRQDTEAVGMISEWLDSKDTELRHAAIDALGKIASDAAVMALMKSIGDKQAVADALLEAASQNHAQAASILQTLQRPEMPASVQAAALREAVALNPGETDDQVLLALQSPAAPVRQAAINACRQLNDASVLTNVLAVKLPELAAEEQQMALAVLGDSGDTTVVTQLAPLLHHDRVEPVSIITVLGKLGGLDAAHHLMDLIATSTDDDLKEVARDALAMMPGTAVQASLMTASQKGDIDRRRDALAALGSRGDRDVVPFLFSQINQGPKAIRHASLDALGQLATDDDLPKLLSLAKDGDERVTKAIQLACRRAQDPDKAAGTLVNAMNGLSVDVKKALIPSLRVLGGEHALASVRGFLQDKDLGDTALKALTSWSGPEGAAALLELASSTDIAANQQVLALRGIGRLISDRESGMNRDERTQLALKAMALAKRPSEKRLFLPVLGQLGTPEALKALSELHQDKELGEEAVLATLTAVKGMRGRRAARLRQDLLKDIIRADVSEAVTKEATELLER